MSRHVLVAGVGNIFLGDDGFGVEVAARLAAMSLPEGVEVEDFGIRSVHLAYQLLDGYDALVLVDAVRQGDEPGTLSVIEQQIDDLAAGEQSPIAVDAHRMDPTSVLDILGSIGGKVGQVFVVACEAGQLEEQLGLSEAVARAVPGAVKLVLELCRKISSAKVEAATSAGWSRLESSKEGEP